MKSSNKLTLTDGKLGGARQTPSKLDFFIKNAFYIVFFIIFIIISIFVAHDNARTKRQIREGYEKALNSPEMQKYNAAKKKQERELARKKRLKELGINTTTEPTQKDDLLNAKLREQEERQEQELKGIGKQKEGLDYQEKLAIYNAEREKVDAELGR